MSQEVINALIITGIGMSLVFVAILLLWWMMAALVRLLPHQVKTAQNSAEVAMAEEKLRQLAAAIAVAAALNQTPPMGPSEFPLPPTAVVSPWQAVSRSRVLNRRGHTR